MVVPDNVVRAVKEADITTVVAWLDAGGDVNDTAGPDSPFFPGDTLLMGIPQSDEANAQHVELAKILLQRGADVNRVPDQVEDGYSALHCCIDNLSMNSISTDAAILEIIAIYLASGANVNHRNWGEETPLHMALIYRNWGSSVNERRRSAFESVKLLLQAGASLDGLGGDSRRAEDVLRANDLFGEMAGDQHYIACQKLVSELRVAGSWKAYTRAPPKALLRLRSLIARGRAREKVRTRRRTPREISLLLAPAFPNELCWRVLEYWNPRYEARRTPSP